MIVRMKKLKLVGVCLLSLLLLPTVDAHAQNNAEKVVTLVVTGMGDSKDEATKSALRSAIEQAFGTFVSSNTSILDDELVRDEVVTISSGNIQSYEEVSCNAIAETVSVTLKAVVAVNKLLNFARSKGSEAELAGAAFAMNMKIRQLNKENELEVMTNLIEELEQLSLAGMFDYKLDVKDAYQHSKDYYAVPIVVHVVPNENMAAFMRHYKKTVQALALSPEEVEEYRRSNTPTYNFPDAFSLVDVKLRNKYEVFAPYNDEQYRLPFIDYFLIALNQFSVWDNQAPITRPYVSVVHSYLDEEATTQRTWKYMSFMYADDLNAESDINISNERCVVREYGTPEGRIGHETDGAEAFSNEHSAVLLQGYEFVNLLSYRFKERGYFRIGQYSEGHRMDKLLSYSQGVRMSELAVDIASSNSKRSGRWQPFRMEPNYRIGFDIATVQMDILFTPEQMEKVTNLYVKPEAWGYTNALSPLLNW